MCKMASFILTEKKVFWSNKTDSHENIISEFNLSHLDKFPIGSLRVKIVPPNNDYLLEPEKWEFNIDQDKMPEWYDFERDKIRILKAFRAWYESGVIKKTDKIDVLERQIKINLGTIIRNYAVVENNYGNAVVKYNYRNAVVKNNYAVVENNRDDAVVENNYAVVKYNRDDAVVENNHGMVENNRDDAVVKNNYGNAVVRIFGKNAKAYRAAEDYKSVVIIDYTGKTVKVLIGEDIPLKSEE